MKLIEKKCPNCGANLKFENNSKEVTCNYCNATFIIDRENSKMHDEFSSEFINLQRKNVKRISNVVFIFSFVIFFIVILIFLIIFFKISRGGF